MKSIINRLKCQIHGINKKKRKQPITVKPMVRRYFFVCPHNIALLETPYTINANQFVDDQGEAIQLFRTYRSSGYTNLFINGVMQGSSLYQISSNSLQLNATGQIIYEGTPIIIEAIGFKLVVNKVGS